MDNSSELRQECKTKRTDWDLNRTDVGKYMTKHVRDYDEFQYGTLVWGCDQRDDSRTG